MFRTNSPADTMNRYVWGGGFVLVTLIFVNVVSAGNTTCNGNQVDWYTNAVGETPCTTYQRLRQICNSDYQVPIFRQDTPGDSCDDQLQDCCCNSISWALSMLCMNCQYNAPPNGIDAGATAYTLYRTRSDGKLCSPGTNQSLPSNVQSAVCNSNIRLDNFLYELFWNTGDWFYVYTKSQAQLEQAQFSNNTFTHCANQISPSATATKSSSTTMPASPAITSPPPQTSGAEPSTAPTTTDAAAIGGGIGGALVFVSLFAIGLWFFCRRRRNVRRLRIDLEGEYVAAVTEEMSDAFPARKITPFALSDTEPSSTTNLLKSRGKKLSDLDGQAQIKVASSGLPSSSSGLPSSSDASQTVPSSSRVDMSERHQDAGSLPIGLERSVSGRLPPAYMSWDSNGRLNDPASPQTPRSLPRVPSKSQPVPDQQV